MAETWVRENEPLATISVGSTGTIDVRPVDERDARRHAVGLGGWCEL